MSNKVEVQTRNIRLRTGETETINPHDFLRILHNENPFLRPISLAMLENDRELFWHETMVATGYENLISKLSPVLNGNHTSMRNRSTGVFLHDIGKMGIINGSIKLSMDIINYTPHKFKKNKSQKDQRPREIVARTHTHPLVGASLIRLFVEQGIIPPEIGIYAAGIALHHHRSDGTYRTSYPWSEQLKGKNNVQVASEYLAEMMDFTIAMLTDRDYRDALNMKKVEKELAKYLNNDAVLKFILPVFELQNIDELKIILHDQAIEVLNEIQPQINTIPLKENIIDLIGEKEKNRRFDLQDWFNLLWDARHKEFNRLYKQEIQNGFHEDGR